MKRFLSKSILIVISCGLIVIPGIASANTQEIFEGSDYYIDKTRQAVKTTTAPLLSNLNSNNYSIKATITSDDAPTYTSKIKGDFHSTSSKSLHATATSKSTEAIDYIYAKAKIYEDDGLLASAEDENENSTFAGATAKASAGLVNWDNDARGYHTYKYTGYKDVTHETYTDSW